MSTQHNVTMTFQLIDNFSGQMTRINQQMEQFNQRAKTVTQTQTRQVSTGKKVTQANKGVSGSTAETSKQIQGATQANKNWLSSYTESIGIAVRSTVLWAAATTAIYGTKRALEDMNDVLVDTEEKMVALQRVMDDLTTDFDEMRVAAGDMAFDFGQTADEVINAMVQWGRQGREQVEVLELTEASILATNVAQMELDDAVSKLTATILQFNYDASDAVGIIDTWNEVANNFATTATDLGESIQEAGAAARNAGVEMEELVGMTTALTAATAKSGRRIGTALRTMFSRMRGSGEEGAQAITQVEEQLNAVGIAVRESEDEFRSVTDVLDDLAFKWEELTSVQQANIGFVIGGRRRYSDLISLIENWDMAVDATTTGLEAQDSAMRENEIAMEGLAKVTEQTRSALERLYIQAGRRGMVDVFIRMQRAMQGVINGLNNFIVGLDEAGVETYQLVIAFGALTTAMIGTTKALKALKAVLAGLKVLLSVKGAIIVGVIAAVRLFAQWGEKARELEKHLDSLSGALDVFERAMEDVHDLSLPEIELGLEELEITANLRDEFEEVMRILAEIEEMGVIPPRGEDAEDWAEELDALHEDLDKALKSFDEETYAIEKTIQRIEEITGIEIEFKVTEIDPRDFETLQEAENYLNELESALLSSALVQEDFARETFQAAQEQRRYVQELENWIDTLLTADRSSPEFVRALQNITDEYGNLNVESENFEEHLAGILARQKMIKDVKMGDATKEIEERTRQLNRALQIEEQNLEEVNQKLLATEDLYGMPNLDEHIQRLMEERDQIQQNIDVYEGAIVNIEGFTEALQSELDSLDSGIFMAISDEIISAVQDLIEEFDELEESVLNIRQNIRVGLQSIDFQMDVGFIDDDETTRLESRLDVFESAANEVVNMYENLIRYEEDFQDVLESPEQIDEMVRALRSMQRQAAEAKDLDEMFRIEEIIKDLEKGEIDVAELERQLEELGKDIQSDIGETRYRLYIEEFDVGTDALFDMPQEELDEFIEDMYSALAEFEDTDLFPTFLENLISGAEQVRILNMRTDEMTARAERATENWSEMMQALNAIEDADSIDSLHNNLNEVLEIQDDIQSKVARGLISPQAIQITEDAIADLREEYQQLRKATEFEEELEERNERHQAQLETNEKRVRELISTYGEWQDMNIYEMSQEELEELIGSQDVHLAQVERLVSESEDALIGPKTFALIKAGIDEIEGSMESFLETMIEYGSVVEDIQAFDLIDVSGVVDARENIEQMRQILRDMGQDEEIRKFFENLGLEEEDIETIIENLYEYIENTKEAWHVAVVEGVGEALRTGIDYESNLRALEVVLESIMSEIFQIEGAREDLLSFFEGIGDNISDFIDFDFDTEAFSTGIVVALESAVDGGSLGATMATGLGAGIGAIFGMPQIGAALGRLAGQIGEKLFGGHDGLDPEKVARMERDIIEAGERFAEFGLDDMIPDADIVNKAGTLQRIFGGTDLEVVNIEEVEAALEDLAPRLESIWGDVSQGFASALRDATSYGEFKEHFRQSVGQALQEAVIEGIMQGAMVEGMLQDLTAEIMRATADGVITDEELANIEAAYLAGQAAFEDSWEQMERLLASDFFDFDQDVDRSQTFRAGTTTSITYHNTFSVQSQVFLGDEAQAKEAARLLMPYIRDELQWETGN